MVRAKKHLGQHFLTDPEISSNINKALTGFGEYNEVLEVGPGTGALTRFLLEGKYKVSVAEIDQESIAYLHEHFPNLPVYAESFLQFDLHEKFEGRQLAVIGNFPYNISSQIVFKILDNVDLVPEAVGMFQKEVAERIAEKPGSKTYGVTSVLTQAYYDVEYLFTVNEDVFDPPPKVKSGVIRMKRKPMNDFGCDKKLFKQIVKITFNQRRKTIRNSIKSLVSGLEFQHDYLPLRPEQLSVEQFKELAIAVSEKRKAQSPS